MKKIPMRSCVVTKEKLPKNELIRIVKTEDGVVVDDLDFVILGATEIDTNFNVNVTTDSHGTIMGGSGGHSDTAHGAKLTIITTNLVKSRLPIIKDEITTIFFFFRR